MLQPLVIERYRSSLLTLVITALMLGGAMLAIHSLVRGQTQLLGLLYIVTFMMLAWKFRTAAMFCIYLSALFPVDIGGAGVAVGIGELHLALITVLLILDFVIQRWPIPRNPLYIPVAFYIGICIISSMYHPRGTAMIISIVQMFLYFIITTAVFSNFLPHTYQHLRVVQSIIYGGIFLACGIMMTGSNYFLDMHKNAIGGALSYAIVICLELWYSAPWSRYKSFLLLALAIIAVGLFHTLSRGGWMGAVVGMLTVIILRGDIRFLIKVLLVMIPVVCLSWTQLPEEQRFYIFSFDVSQANIRDRLDTIMETQKYFDRAPLIGFGVGLRKTLDATNIVWITLAETGILGFLGFLGVHLAMLIMAIKACRLLDPKDPRYSLVVIGTGLVFGKVVHGCVDHYWSRGSLLVVWGAAGMAIAAYYSALRDARQEVPTA